MSRRPTRPSAALPTGTVETLLKPENKDQLTKVRTCHVLAADEMAAAIEKAAADYGGSVGLKTVGGCEFTAMVKDGTLMIRDGQGNVADVRDDRGRPTVERRDPRDRQGAPTRLVTVDPARAQGARGAREGWLLRVAAPGLEACGAVAGSW